MAALSFICSTKFLFVLLVISAIPIGILISLESTPPPTHFYQYNGPSWLHECAKWDGVNRRFLVTSMDGGGLSTIAVSGEDHHHSSALLTAVTVVKDVDLLGNGTFGFTIDRERNRVVVAVADVIGNKYSAVAAYDLTSWKRLFLTHLASSGDGQTFADDVAVDDVGNAYVTDAKGNKIWKVGLNGELLAIIRNPLFVAKEWYKNVFNLNGIVYHPNGYLLVGHTIAGYLFKIDVKNDNPPKLVKIENGLGVNDGFELLSPTKLVVVGAYGVRLVESTDDWESAKIIGRSPVLKHRMATAATSKDDKVYVSYAIGMGYPKKKHLLVEAIFS